MNYIVKSLVDVVMSMGKVKECGIIETVLNSCFIVLESEFSREIECDH